MIKEQKGRKKYLIKQSDMIGWNSTTPAVIVSTYWVGHGIGTSTISLSSLLSPQELDGEYYDGFAVDGDGIDEVFIATEDDVKVCIYEPSHRAIRICNSSISDYQRCCLKDILLGIPARLMTGA